MSAQDVAARFARETADHQMTVLLDQGMHRHLRFKNPESSMYWFELITVPGSLTFRGDGQSFVFARLTDMFEFFRNQRINPGYWAEKLTSCREEGVRRYERENFEARVKEAFVEEVRHGDAPIGLGRAVRRDLLDVDGAWTAEDAHRLLSEFGYYRNERDEYAHFEVIDGVNTWVPAKAPDFRFYDTWEWDFLDYDWWFLWSLHAIVWGIAQYDAHQRRTAAGGLVSTPTGRVYSALSESGAFPDDPESRREAGPLVGELFAIARHHQRDEALPLIAEALDGHGVGTAGSLTGLADTVYTAARKET